MRINIRIEVDEATPGVEAIRSALRTDRLGMNRMIAARALLPVQAHLRNMALTNHNKFGARSSFWNLMVSGTHASATDAEAIIGMPAPVALRYFGGTVVPSVAKMLAIPNRIEAYGRSPRDFPDLQCVPFKSAGGGEALALVERQSQFIRILKRGVKRGPVVGFADKADAQARATEADVYFWLVPSATISGDPDVLPSESELLAAAQGGVDSWFSRLIRKGDR